MASFPERLRELRKYKDVGQKEVGAIIGLSESSIGKYELGERTPDPDSIIKLADFFNVSTDYLLGISNERRPGAGVLPIDDPEVLAFMQSVTSQFRLAPNITDKARQEILEDMADYFKFQLEKRKNKSPKDDK